MRIKRQTASYDVVIIGGGLAGTCAAIASARGGAKTALIQDRPMSRSIKQTMSSKRIKEQTLGLPPELTRDYCVALYAQGAEVDRQEIRGNHQRMNRVRFPGVTCDKAEVVVLATYGDPQARVFEVRAYAESRE